MRNSNCVPRAGEPELPELENKNRLLSAPQDMRVAVEAAAEAELAGAHEDVLPYTEDGRMARAAAAHVQDEALRAALAEGVGAQQARQLVVDWLAVQGAGRSAKAYRLRDWLFSRQRYWGEPFPMAYDQSGQVVPMPEDTLPVKLPQVESYEPTGTGDSPLAAIDDWVNFESESGEPMTRETLTMPQWAGSCWYYLRYLDPNNSQALVDPRAEKYWMPVDLYVGGGEHACLHLLYARFWHKVLFDIGAVSTPEPFQKLVCQGMVLGPAQYSAQRDTRSGEFVSWGSSGADEAGALEVVPLQPADVRKASGGKGGGDTWVLSAGPDVRVNAVSHKMSKSRGNVISPDDVIAEFGADSLRLYTMFVGPLEASKAWSTEGLEGTHRFLSRLWRLYERHLDEGPERLPARAEGGSKEQKALGVTIERVTAAIEAQRFNVAISAMMYGAGWNQRKVILEGREGNPLQY